MCHLLMGAVVVLVALLDACKRLSLMRWWLLGPLLLVGPHLVVWGRLIFASGLPPVPKALAAALTLGGLLYAYVRVTIFPVRQYDCDSRRVRILWNGQAVLRAGMWGLALQGILYIAVLFLAPGAYARLGGWAIGDGIVTAIVIGSMILLGSVCILCTCRRLGLVRRLLVFIHFWIPLVNLLLMHYLCRAARDEYDHECFQVAAQSQRAESMTCATRYPLVMVHGVGFRDLRYFNYWGRIPRALQRCGATIYYGHQEAWGSIEENARIIGEKIEEILAERGCEKVNIIAHSKGGLDSRYLITVLGKGDRVASLTTISTPHRGSQLIDVIDRLPRWVYDRMTGAINAAFRKVGDTNPDSGAAVRQLSPAYAATFNQDVPDDPRVYYQSYTSVMKNMFSNCILGIPYLLLKAASKGQPNDGLVCVESAKWGKFRGVFANRYRRGIAHGDIIDLQREDYKGFDVTEAYFRIVEDLKKRGF